MLQFFVFFFRFSNCWTSLKLRPDKVHLMDRSFLLAILRVICFGTLIKNAEICTNFH